MVILGGMGNTAGVAFAAVLLTVLGGYLRFVARYTSCRTGCASIAANRTIIYSLVLIALMLLRPQGLFGGIPRVRAAAPQASPKAGAAEPDFA